MEYPESVKENIQKEKTSPQQLLETLCGSQDPEAFTKNLGLLRHKLGGGNVAKGEKVNLSKTVKLDGVDNVVFLSILTNVYDELKKYNMEEAQKIAKLIERQETKLKVQ